MGHGWVPEVAADVVDDLDSGGDGALGGGGVVGVDREDGLRALLQNGFDDREDAGLFFFGSEGGGVGAGGFAADVEEVGSFVEHLEGVIDGAGGSAFAGVEVAAVGEAVRGDVEDAHEEGAPAEREGASAEVPVEVWAGREGHGWILDAGTRG